MAVITCENVTKIYGSGENRIAALDDVNLSVEPGEFVTVMGASGSGNPRCCTFSAVWTARRRGRLWSAGKMWLP